VRREREFKMKTLLLITFFLLANFTASQWVQTQSTPEGSGITGMTVTQSGYIVVSTGSVSGGQQGGIRVSSDGGSSWSNVLNGYIGRCVTAGAYGMYASYWNYPSSNEGIYYSYNHMNWGPVFNFPATGNNIFSLLNPIDSVIFAGTRTGVLRSIDFGVSFNYTNTGIPANSWVLDLAADSNNIIAAATTNGLFISTNLGDSWQQTTGIPAGDTVTFIGFYRPPTDNRAPGHLLIGTDDGKINWSSEVNFYAQSFLLSLLPDIVRIEDGFLTFDRFFIVASPKAPQQTGGGVYQSTNQGQTFTVLNNGLPPNPSVPKIIAVPEDTGSIKFYLGLFNNQNNGASVYSQSFPIGIQQISNEVPEGFSLSQNYPNPFNPVTKIRFDIPPLEGAGGRIVQIKIFDILGREISTLVNEQLKPGTYEIDWNAANYPSGVYFYKLIADGFSETKKMMIVK